MTTSTHTSKSPRKTPEQWRAIVEDFSTSGLSAPNFCKQENIQYASFSKWRKRLSTTQTEPVSSNEQVASFIDVSALVNENTNWHITLKLGNGVELVLNQA